MIKGRYYNYFSHERTQINFFQILGILEEDKKHIVFESDHILCDYCDAIVREKRD